MKRGYLLPEGCKDLADVAKFQQKQVPEALFYSHILHKAALYNPTAKSWTVSAPPPLTRQVYISSPTSVKKLAALLEQKPFRIICDLVQLGIWASVDSLLDFEAISAVARIHGFEAIKAG